MSDPNPFTLKVIAALRQIPRGKVATYQQVAGLAGKLHASRGVAWILNSMSKKYKLPWQRVINSQGRISFKPGTYHFRMQRRLLMSEGVKVDAQSGAVDMKRFQYKKKPRVKRARNQPRMFS
jgi:methylated-DNA-protein-cysteine methyltransferase-like protein